MREMSSLFGHGTEAMEGRNIAVSQAADWLIVIQHLCNASGALARWAESQRESGPPQPARLAAPADRVPSILPFDRLAGLTTAEGARRLASAAGQLAGGREAWAATSAAAAAAATGSRARSRGCLGSTGNMSGPST